MNKTTRTVIAVGLLAAFILWLILTVLPQKEEAPGRDPSQARPGSTYEPKFRQDGTLSILAEEDTLKTITIEIASTPEQIEYGMMYRKSLQEEQGMLFLMGPERPLSFWMKNTYVPLDIIFINDQQRIVSIQKNAQPLSEKSLPSGEAASLVLEVQAGFSDRYGLRRGNEIHYAWR